MKKQKTLGAYEKGIIITGVAVLIIFLILLTADGIKNIGKSNKPIALSEQEEVIPPNVPVLSAGMIPVKYNGDNLIICKNDNSWYNYENGTPAYMMLNDGVYQSELTVDMTNKKLASENIGQTVLPEEQGTIYMWIPRFEINSEENIKYVQNVNYESEGYEIPEMFTHKQELETSPDFLLTGIWIEKTPLANASDVTAKITNMQGENNKYGFIANTVGVAMTEEDKTIIGRAMLAPTNGKNQNVTAGAQAMHNEAVTRDARTATIICARMDAPSNPNRTVLQILNDKYQDPIKAKVEYNKTTGLIETTVTYSKYGINKIMLEDTTELSVTNINGIITANTEGITLESGTYKITITDKNGTSKRLKVRVPLQYGREVLGYECEVPGIKWRLFHADDNNIYLIADDYVSYENLPTSTNGTALNKGNTNYKVYFTSILNDYTGSSWIKQNTNEQAQEWINKYLSLYPNITNANMKAVAYMMDTESWSTFAGDKAEYAIGGPTLELFCASYKVTHPDKYIECDSITSNGYQVKWSNGSYANYINGLTQDDFDSIYIKSDTSKANGMWIASPSAAGASNVMSAYYGGRVNYGAYNGTSLCFRPVVCLKSGTKLMDNGDDTYSIKEPIMANIEYKEIDGTIEIAVKYSENGIAKIEDENGKAISYSNENGIIKAVVPACLGTNKFIITDNKGITKELKVTIPFTYGTKVFGYECATEGVEWRLYHEDGNNIYLIADDYIPYENLPTSTNGTALNKGNTNYKAYFTNILNDYTGSGWIKENTNEHAQKWLSKYLTAYPNSTNNNIKAVAYMMDTNSWSGFAGEKAEYAIGGPTLEMFCASYKQTHPSKYIECDSVNENGYQVKWSDDSSYSYYTSGLTLDDFNSIYIKTDHTKANCTWFSSPATDSTDYIILAGYDGSVSYGAYSNSPIGFRPVVCLKPNVKLMDNGDSTYSIKETITAKAEYNSDTNQIEVRVAYSEHGVSKIMLNNTNELSMSNTNGITIANTAGISLKDGTYTITITDTKGNVKELELEVKIPLSIYYGKVVTNYTCEASGVDKWRVFHQDENNIYLIADDYIPYANLPTSTAETALNKGETDYRAYFTAILSNYTGSAWISSNTNEQARNWLSWVNSYPSSTNNNIKAVAYMMDTNKWSTFKGDKAEYAIGGPTLELFCASYKVTHPTRYVECDSVTRSGYKVKWSDGSYANHITGLTQDDFDSIYIKSDTSKANGMWIASPSANNTSCVMLAYYNGNVTYSGYDNAYSGFRPLVCLKSGVQIVDNGDGTCSIQ